MARLIRTSTAERDLVKIGLHIAEDSVEAALRVLDVIDEHLQLIAQYPMMGENCPELGRELRKTTIGKYVVFHRPLGDEVCIVRVLHGARDIPTEIG